MHLTHQKKVNKFDRRKRLTLEDVYKTCKRDALQDMRINEDVKRDKANERMSIAIERARRSRLAHYARRANRKRADKPIRIAEASALMPYVSKTAELSDYIKPKKIDIVSHWCYLTEVKQAAYIRIHAPCLSIAGLHKAETIAQIKRMKETKKPAQISKIAQPEHKENIRQQRIHEVIEQGDKLQVTEKNWQGQVISVRAVLA